MKGDGTYTKLARNDSERRMTYLLTPLPGGLIMFTVGPSVASRAQSRHVIFGCTNVADTTRPQGTARRGTEGTTRRARAGSRRGGGHGGGRGRRHFNMKKKEKKRVLPGEPASLYIHINAE